MAREFLGNIKGTQLISSVFAYPVTDITVGTTVLNDEINIPNDILRTRDNHINIVLPCTTSGELDFDVVLKRGSEEYFRLPVLIEETGRSYGQIEIDLYSTPEDSDGLVYTVYKYPSPSGVKTNYKQIRVKQTSSSELMSLSVERREGGYTLFLFGSRVYKLG